MNKGKGLELCSQVIGMLYECCSHDPEMVRGEQSTGLLSKLAYQILVDFGFTKEEADHIAGTAVNCGEYTVSDLLEYYQSFKNNCLPPVYDLVYEEDV